MEGGSSICGPFASRNTSACGPIVQMAAYAIAKTASNPTMALPTNLAAQWASVPLLDGKVQRFCGPLDRIRDNFSARRYRLCTSSNCRAGPAQPCQPMSDADDASGDSPNKSSTGVSNIVGVVVAAEVGRAGRSCPRGAFDSACRLVVAGPGAGTLADSLVGNSRCGRFRFGTSLAAGSCLSRSRFGRAHQIRQ